MIKTELTSRATFNRDFKNSIEMYYGESLYREQLFILERERKKERRETERERQRKGKRERKRQRKEKGERDNLLP